MEYNNCFSIGHNYLAKEKVIDNSSNIWAQCQKIYIWTKKHHPEITLKPPDNVTDKLYVEYVNTIGYEIVLADFHKRKELSNSTTITAIYLDNPLKEYLKDKTFEFKGVIYHVKAPKYRMNDIVYIELNNGNKYTLDELYKYLYTDLALRIPGRLGVQIISINPLKVKWTGIQESINGTLDLAKIYYVKNKYTKFRKVLVQSQELVEGKSIRTKIDVPVYTDTIEDNIIENSKINNVINIMDIRPN